MPSLSVAEAPKCSTGDEINKRVTNIARSYAKRKENFPGGVFQKKGRKLKGGFDRRDPENIKEETHHAFLEAVFRITESNITYPPVPWISFRFTKKHMMHLCWTMKNRNNFRAEIYFMKGYGLDRFKSLPFDKKIGTIVTSPFRTILRKRKPYARISAANVRKSILEGSITWLERLVFAGLLPDFIRDTLVQIPSLITHDVLSLFYGDGIESLVITQEGVLLQYGVDLLGMNQPVKSKFIPFNFNEYEKPLEESND
jgi:hypothetical protein